MPAQTKILFVTSEIFPLIKTGGLGDISGSLPLALRNMGLDVRVLLPGYRAVLEQLPGATPLADVSLLAGDAGGARLLSCPMPDSGVPLLLLDCPALYDRPGGPYLSPEGSDWPDNVRRFGLLSQVGALLASSASPLQWMPDVVHCNDWQGGLLPALLHYTNAPRAKTVISIHNLAFQGSFEREWVTRLGLPAASYAMHGVEFYGHFSFLKAGIYYADQITTVSKTYSAEIQTPEFGYGMDGLLLGRRADLHGIVNGIGGDWNPATDKHLHRPYDRATLHHKTSNKLQLQHELHLKAGGDIPLMCVVSRLTHQKGIDLILECAEELLQGGAQLVVLGSGEAQYERRLRKLARSHAGSVSVTLGYHEGLAHRIMAGGDIFLMPSRFEPCGLSQMYGMAYGTPPVVRRTGGLADTVTDSNETTLHDGSATGFVFEQQSPAGFMHAVQHALACYRTKHTWHTIQQNGMRRDFGWERAAQDYVDVYRAALQLPERQFPESPLAGPRLTAPRLHEAAAPESQLPGTNPPKRLLMEM